MEQPNELRNAVLYRRVCLKWLRAFLSSRRPLHCMQYSRINVVTTVDVRRLPREHRNVCMSNFESVRVCRTVGGTHSSLPLSILKGRHMPKNFFYKNHKTSTRTTSTTTNGGGGKTKIAGYSFGR